MNSPNRKDTPPPLHHCWRCPGERHPLSTSVRADARGRASRLRRRERRAGSVFSGTRCGREGSAAPRLPPWRAGRQRPSSPSYERAEAGACLPPLAEPNGRCSPLRRSPRGRSRDEAPSPPASPQCPAIASWGQAVCHLALLLVLAGIFFTCSVEERRLW